jgi:hypothetical protein
MDADPKNKENWGAPDFKDFLGWTAETASSISVLQGDKKAITPHQVEAIAQYCQNEPYSIMLTAQVETARENVVGNWMCQAKFEEYLDKLKKRKVNEGDESWASVVSPYKT